MNPSIFQKELATIKHLGRVNDIKICLDWTTSLPRKLKQTKNVRWMKFPFELSRPLGFHLVYYKPVTFQSLLVEFKDRTTTG